MRNKWLCLLLAAVLTALAGCSLARPERETAAEDRWIGFYVVYNPPGTYDPFSSNPHLTEMGTTSLDTGKYGALTIPQKVLLGVEDPDTGDLTFPGLTGYSLFIRHKQEDYGPVTQVVSDMSPGEEGTTINSSDRGTAETASGVIWWGPPLDAPADWDPYESAAGIWHAYRVYETADGQTVYLDGSGNSYSGGGNMGFSEDAAYTYTENGESLTDSVSVSVSVKYTPRLTALRVVEFGDDNTVVNTTEVPLTEELPALSPAVDTAFLIVEEESGEGVKRTLYPASDWAEGAVYHEVVLLDQEGRGRGAYLAIGEEAAA